MKRSCTFKLTDASIPVWPWVHKFFKHWAPYLRADDNTYSIRCLWTLRKNNVVELQSISNIFSWIIKIRESSVMLLYFFQRDKKEGTKRLSLRLQSREDIKKKKSDSISVWTFWPTQDIYSLKRSWTLAWSCQFLRAEGMFSTGNQVWSETL